MTLSELLKKLKLKEESLEKCYGLEQLDKIKELGKDVFFYTGKGPSNEVLHLGHYLIYKKFAQWSHIAPVIFQIAGDEKRGVKKQYIGIKKAKEYTQNLKKTLSKWFNWNYEKTYLVDNLDKDTSTILLNCANYIAKNIKLKTALGAFGNVNLYFGFFLALQMAPILLFERINSNKTCILVTAEDQRACFLILRDIAKELGIKKPIILTLKSLKDTQYKEKMSASKCKYAISVEPTLNLNNLEKSISAPFIKGQPNIKKDYLAYLTNFLINNDIKKEELKELKDSYKEGQTALGQQKMTKILKDYFKENAFEIREFKELTKINKNESLEEALKIFEDKYIKNKLS